MPNVVNATEIFGSRKCRPGTLAQHPEHGIVRVVRAAGGARTIEVERRVLPDLEPSTEDLPAGITPDQVLASERIFVSELDVLVSDLVELDPFRDMEPAEQGTVLTASFAGRPY
ncbi:MAG TPA: hypothetical protein VF450_04570 [Noviherbaspirillum sp.]